MGAWSAGTDPYRAWVDDWAYHWGGNEPKCHWGILFAQQNIYGLNASLASSYREAAAGFLHYIHGVNPLTMVYLSNMYGAGAENCANQIYHSWFCDGSIYDDARTSPNGPAPGYVPGGANASFAPDGAYSGPPLVPPMNQPPQKSYKDWNTAWPEDSWEVTEPGIYYQSSYVYLMSRFIRPLTYQDWTSGHGLSGAAADIYADPDHDGVCNLLEYAFGLSPEAPDASAMPQFQLQSQVLNGQPGTYLTVQFLHQLGATNLTYILQGSSDLLAWSDLCTAAGTNAPIGPGFIAETGTAYQRQIVACDTVSALSSAHARFVRFKLVWH